MRDKYIFFLALLIIFAAGLILHGKAEASGVSGYPILAPDGTVYQIAEGAKRGYRTAEVFFSHGYKFSDALQAKPEELALPMEQDMGYAEGTLVKGSSPTVFVISNGKKRPFTSAQVFRALEYSFGNVVYDGADLLLRYQTAPAIDSALVAHTPGSLINIQGAVFLVTLNGKKGIASVEIFSSYRYDFKNVLPANQADKALPDEGLISLRQIESPSGSSTSPQPSPEPVPSSNAPNPPTISGYSAAFPSTTASYELSATDPDGDNLTLTVEWGDGSTKQSTTLASGGTWSVSHSWSYSGDYALAVTAEDPAGNLVQATKNIKVSTDASTFGPAITVLSPNGGESFSKTSVVKIAWRRNWEPQQSFRRADVYFSRSGINSLIKADINDVSYNWVPKDTTGIVAADNYKIVVISQGSASAGVILSDQSDAEFRITE